MQTRNRRTRVRLASPAIATAMGFVLSTAFLGFTALLAAVTLI